VAVKPIETKYVDRPEISEAFADHFENLFYDGTTLRLEFCVRRFDELKQPEAPTGRRYPVCRLVLSNDAALNLFNQLQKLVGAMEQKGLVKRESPPKAKPGT